MAGQTRYYLTNPANSYEASDMLTVTKENSRDQKTFVIAKVLTEKVNKHWCILLLNDAPSTLPLIKGATVIFEPELDAAKVPTQTVDE